MCPLPAWGEDGRAEGLARADPGHPQAELAQGEMQVALAQPVGLFPRVILQVTIAFSGHELIQE